MTVTDVGTGFGTPEHNMKVEAAGMTAAVAALPDWIHTDVSGEKCGWDITFRRGREELHVEVKGVSGSKPTILLTANEWRAATDDEHWRLVIVTHALLDEPSVIVVNREAVASKAMPIVYRFAASG
jgi:hypothetical protein